MSRRRAGLLLLAALAVALLDGASPAAAIYLERCAAAGSPAAVAGMALNLPAHAAAFPWTMAAMLGLCLPWRRAASWPATLAASLRRLCLMPLTMVPACLLAWPLAAAAPAALRTHVFAFAMLLLSALGEGALSARGQVRRA